MSTSNQQGTPEGFSTVTPYLCVDDAAAAIDFYTAAFGAVETFRVNRDATRIAHAEIRIGNSQIMLADKAKEFAFMKTAKDLRGTPVSIYLYLPDADTLYQRALENGAEMLEPMADAPDGDRRGGIIDPFGLIWWLATSVDPEGREKMQKEYQQQSG